MRTGPFASKFAEHGMVCAVDHLAAAGRRADAAARRHRRGRRDRDERRTRGHDPAHVRPRWRPVRAGARAGRADAVALNASGRSGSGADLDRLRADGHTGDAAVRGHPRRCRCPAASTAGPRCTRASASCRWREVLEPARLYAADGFPASQPLARARRERRVAARWRGVRRRRRIPARSCAGPASRERSRRSPTAAATRSTAGSSARSARAGRAAIRRGRPARRARRLGRAVVGAGLGPRRLDDAAELAGLSVAGRVVDRGRA